VKIIDTIARKFSICEKPMKSLVTKTVVSQLLLFVFGAVLFAQGLQTAKPESVQMSSVKLNQIDGLVEKAIAEKKMPGAVVLVGRRGKIVFKKAYGNRALVPKVEKMTTDTIFDLASLTKPIATATSIMILVEQGKLRLNDTVGKFIPDIDDPEAKKITIKQLLTHTSGYRPDFDLGEKWFGRKGMLTALKKEKLRNPRGAKFVYSDIGFIVLGEIVQRLTGNISGQFVAISKDGNKDVENLENVKEFKWESRYSSKSLADFTYRNIFEVLGLSRTKFPQPGMWWAITQSGFEMPNKVSYINQEALRMIAPTEKLTNQQSYLG